MLTEGEGCDRLVRGVVGAAETLVVAVVKTAGVVGAVGETPMPLASSPDPSVDFSVDEESRAILRSTPSKPLS